MRRSSAPRSPLKPSTLGRDATLRDSQSWDTLSTAVEPTAELRTRAAELHPSPRIEWLDDSLPALSYVSTRGITFDIVMLTAVWMHLDEQQRQSAMPKVAALVRPGGVMMLSLRHGPVPAGRRMFEVTSDETTSLAKLNGMNCVHHLEDRDTRLRRPGVWWDRLVFIKQMDCGCAA